MLSMCLEHNGLVPQGTLQEYSPGLCSVGLRGSPVSCWVSRPRAGHLLPLHRLHPHTNAKLIPPQSHFVHHAQRIAALLLSEEYSFLCFF